VLPYFVPWLESGEDELAVFGKVRPVSAHAAHPTREDVLCESIPRANGHVAAFMIGAC
jgi:hypothetical protein